MSKGQKAVKTETTPAQAVNASAQPEKTVQIALTNAELSTQPEPNVEPSIPTPEVNPPAAAPDEFKTEQEHSKTTLEPWMQERLAREKAKTERERRAREDAEHELMMMRSKQSQSQSQITGTPQPQDSEIPDDPVQIIQKVVAEAINKNEQERQQRQQIDAQNAAALAFKNRIDQGRHKYEDFEDVVHAENAPISPPVVLFLRDIPNPDDFAYNLVKHNSDKLEEINKLPLSMQIVKINELYQKFMAKTHRKTVSNAPVPPSKPVSSNADSKSVNNMSYDDIFKAVNRRR